MNACAVEAVGDLLLSPSLGRVPKLPSAHARFCWPVPRQGDPPPRAPAPSSPLPCCQRHSSLYTLRQCMCMFTHTHTHQRHSSLYTLRPARPLWSSRRHSSRRLFLFQSAYVSIRQHSSAYVSIRQHTFILTASISFFSSECGGAFRPSGCSICMYICMYVCIQYIRHI